MPDTRAIAYRYSIISKYHRIELPGRWRNVVVQRKGLDKARYERRWLEWKASTAVCQAIRAEMGFFSKLQVGEYIIAQGGTAGNFAVHTDAASSEGRELSAFVLGHRSDSSGVSKIKNLLLDLKWAADKTAKTRADDFREVLQGRNTAAMW